jgi:hypothetical protein
MFGASLPGTLPGTSILCSKVGCLPGSTGGRGVGSFGGTRNPGGGRSIGCLALLHTRASTSRWTGERQPASDEIPTMMMAYLRRYDHRPLASEPKAMANMSRMRSYSHYHVGV